MTGRNVEAIQQEPASASRNTASRRKLYTLHTGRGFLAGLAIVGCLSGCEGLPSSTNTQPLSQVPPAVATAYPDCNPLPYQTVEVNKQKGLALAQFQCGNVEVTVLEHDNPDGTKTEVDYQATPPNVTNGSGYMNENGRRVNSTTAVAYDLVNGYLQNVHEVEALPPIRIPGLPPSPTPINT